MGVAVGVGVLVGVALAVGVFVGVFVGVGVWVGVALAVGVCVGVFVGVGVLMGGALAVGVFVGVSVSVGVAVGVGVSVGVFVGVGVSVGVALAVGVGVSVGVFVGVGVLVGVALAVGVGVFVGVGVWVGVRVGVGVLGHSGMLASDGVGMFSIVVSGPSAANTPDARPTASTITTPSDNAIMVLKFSLKNDGVGISHFLYHLRLVFVEAVLSNGSRSVFIQARQPRILDEFTHRRFEHKPPTLSNATSINEKAQIVKRKKTGDSGMELAEKTIRPVVFTERQW